MVMAWLLATAAAGTVAWAIGVSAPGRGLGSILLSLVGGLDALLGVDARGRGTTDIGVIMGGWGTEVRRLASMTGMLVPGSPGSRCWSSASLSLSLSGGKLVVSWDTFSPSKGSPYLLFTNSGLSLYFSCSS